MNFPAGGITRDDYEVQMMEVQSTLAFAMPGWGEMLIVAFIGLLLFGRRLPEVGRSLGKGIVEFKKGLRGIEDDIDNSTNRNSTDRVLPRNDSTASSDHQAPQ